MLNEPAEVVDRDVFTKHALLYGHVRYKDARPIVDVLELLEQPVRDQNRAKLVELLQATNQPSR